MSSQSRRANSDIEILLVEDSPTQAARVRYLMERAGYQTRAANNGKRALEALRERKPSLVLSDVVMPEMDGYTLCRTIKEEPMWSEVPVILVTSLVDPNDILHGLACGADNFVRKPYADDYLLKRIEHVLANQELRGNRGDDSFDSGIALYFGGERHVIKADQRQVLDLLISTYEQAVSVNEEVQAREQQIRVLNDNLARRAAELEVTNEEIVRKNDELKVANRELEIANRELESFSFSVSHDLRAPLRAIDGYSSLLQGDFSSQLPPDGLRYLGLVRDSAHRMGQLIEDLLRFSKTARQPLDTREIDLNRLVRQCVEESRSEIDSRHIQVNIGGLQPCVGDIALLRQVFLNLIGNAVKYTRKQPQPVIDIGCLEQDGEKVVFIKDNGAGFDMKHVDRLFGVFQRLHTQDEFEGTGVGLATVQRIVERHGGRIWAEAAPGRGACFSLTLQPRPA